LDSYIISLILGGILHIGSDPSEYKGDLVQKIIGTTENKRKG